MREYNQLIKVRVQLNQLEKILQTEFYIYHETQTNHQNEWNNNLMISHCPRIFNYSSHPSKLTNYNSYNNALISSDIAS